jgi:hypothetical protein
MNALSRALADLIAVFEKLGTPYAMMGGLAVRVYGIPRPTYDVDFTVAIARDRLPELYRELRALGYTIPEAYETGWVDSVAGMSVVKTRRYLEAHGVDVDLFLAESAFQQSLLGRRRCEQLDGMNVWLVGPEDLVLLNLVSHRPRDMSDIADVLFTQGRLDEAHLRRWAGELGVLDELDRVLAEQ